MNGGLVECIDAAARGFDDLSGDELVAAQREWQVAARKLYAAQLELDAATERAGVPQQHGYAGVRGLLVDVLRLPPREARAREEHREAVAAGRSLTGELLPPRLPETAAALRDGAIGAGHVEAIDQAMRHLPDGFDPQTCAVVEQELAGFARSYSARETSILAAQLIVQLDPDGQAPADPEQARDPENVLFLGRSRRGGLRLRGEFDADGEAAIRAMLDALSKPAPATDGIPDQRSTAERQGDALVDAAHQVLRFGDLPDCGGERPHVAVTIDWEELQHRLRMAMLDYGNTLHPQTARMLACDAQIVPIVLGTASQPLDIGRASRTVPAGLRRALVARAGGHCEMPGCDRPAGWCDAHHGPSHWADGGATRIDNLVLLCRRHHRMVHKPGWHIHFDPHGHPVFTPPAIIDPHRKVRPSRLRC
ncbi:MAG: HNH endonuclease [Actinomycetota bacterium]|nr:HNH endonuclease [Actinomycetota bacterium]